MNIKWATMIAGWLLLASGASAIAAERTPRADHRQARQDVRIAQGVASGELTQREAVKLEVREEHIDRVEQRVKADGTVTAGERARLEVKQDRASRAIYRQKHDRQHWR